MKRVFSTKRPKSVTKSIRVSETMANALEALASESGETLNAYIVWVLDEYLQKQMKLGKVKPPKDL